MGIFRSIGRGLTRLFGRGSAKQSLPVAKPGNAPTAGAYQPPVALPYQPPTRRQAQPVPASQPKQIILPAQELSPTEELLAQGKPVVLASTWQDSLVVNINTSEIILTLKSGAIYAYSFPRGAKLDTWINGKDVAVDIDCVSFAARWVESPSPGRFWWSYVVPNISPARRIRKANKGYKGSRGPRGNVVRLVQRTLH